MAQRKDSNDDFIAQTKAYFEKFNNFYYFEGITQLQKYWMKYMDDVEK